MTRLLMSIAAASMLAGCAASRGQRAEMAKTDNDQIVQPSQLSPEQVRVVQRALASRGQEVDIHGRFDEKTRIAVKSFQKRNNLPATGNLTFATVERLGINPTDVMPVRGEGVGGEGLYDGTSPKMPADDMRYPHDDRVHNDSPDMAR